MKKIYNKLCAIAFALLGATSLSAQDWTAPAIGVDLSTASSSDELYMYNLKADAFACSGMAWGTHAIVKELQNGDTKLSADVHRCRVELPTSGQVKILLNERTYLGGNFANNDCWVDFGSNNTFTYTKVSATDNIYTLQTGEAFLDVSWAHGGHITLGTNGYGNTEWAFIRRTDITNGKYVLYKAKKEMYDIYSRIVEAGHESTFANELATAKDVYDNVNSTAANVNAATKTLIATVSNTLSDKFYSANFLFNNPDMRGYGDDTDWGNGLNAFADGIFESWHSAETITQTQTGIPNGFYTIEFVGMYRQDGTDAAPTLTLSSNGKTSSASLKSIAEIDFENNCAGNNTWTNAAKPDRTYSAGEACTHTDAIVKVENFVVENGELTITVAMPSGSQWLLCQGFQIYYKAESIEEYANLFNAAKNAAEAIDATTLNSYAANILQTALTNAKNEQVNKTWYQEQTAALNEAVALANETVAPYAKLLDLIKTCQSYSANSTPKGDAKTTFDAAIATAESIAPTAQTGDILTNAYATLEAARQTYVVNASPINEVTFDLNFKMTNNWTNGGNTYNAGGIVMRERYFDDEYRTGDMMTQTISGLANGIYTVEIYANANWTPNRGSIKTAAANAGDEVSSVFANETSVKVPLAHQTSTASAGEYILENVEVKNGTITLGLRNDANGANWLLIAPKSLTYVSAFDVTELRNTLSAEITNANNIKGENMSYSVQTQLNNAIEGAVINSDNPDELDTMISDLQKAIADAQSSINDYSRLAKYIAMTKVFTDVAEYETKYNNGDYDSEDVEPVRQELNVLRFNAASEIFTQKIEVTGWTGDLANTLRSDQHWSGNTVSYYDANSWVPNFVGLKHTLTTTITLPQGSYVLKAAGRSSSDATLRLNIKNGDTTIETVEYTGKGDLGYGIDTSGAANFSAEGTYANDNVGRGWEWEFAKFELNTETTVTLLVEVDYNDIQNRFGSFSDITLWMDDDTYLSVNGGAIDAPLAQAKALNTLPMGNSEMSALTSAIALGEADITTADQLNEALAALETAVANANTWRTAYNEAKAPLLKAFDRFEYGFNNGAEGRQVETMNDDAWTALLEAVKTAGADKDITNSYAHFADATTNFNTAMDVAMAQFSMAEQYNSTYYIANADCAVNDAWVGNGRSTATGQHWSGDTERVYFTQNVDGTARTQTISLPYNGWYLLRASVRAANDNTFSKVIVDGVEYTANGPHGTVGGTIATDGSEWDSVADGIAAGKTFANNNAGYGWVYKYIPIKITDATKDVTIGINLTKNASNIGGMDLFFTGKNCHFKEDDIVKHYGDYATGFATTHTTHDVTNATMSGLSLDVTNNPNTIILATEGQVTNEKNVVINGTCANFVLTDGYDFNAVQDFTATETSYNRSFATDTWSTVILPFAHTVSNGVKVEKLKGLLLNHNGKNYIQFETVEEMEANTPYIVQNASFTNLGEKAIKATTNLNTIEGSEATMKGTYKAVTAKELVDAEASDILFVNAAGEVKYIDDEVATDEITFRAFRAYITVANDMFSTSAGVAPQFFIFHGDDDITAIEETLNQKNEEEVIYDLAGRRIVKPTKAGIYIVNGKKMVIK